MSTAEAVAGDAGDRARDDAKREIDRSILKGLTGRQKAAIFLIALGSHRAARHPQAPHGA